MVPLVALIGRPNVGKSTLFNRLTRRRDALVANMAGVTRDRQYGEADLSGRKVVLVDSGGVGIEESGIYAQTIRQSRLAASEADLLLLIVDARAGLTQGDRDILSQLRLLSKPMLLVVNKCDGVNVELARSEFFELGLGEPLLISASHGQGIGALKDSMLKSLGDSEQLQAELEQEQGIRIAVVGRPNVGKSTLVNRLLGEERVVVYDQPGTTRDSIYIRYQRDDRLYTLIDTAGVRRRRSVHEPLEKFSIVKTLQAIADANVVILMVDASEGLVDQDLHLLGHVLESGRALVIACNKWDGRTDEEKQRLRGELDRRLTFVDFADVHFVSALHGSNIGQLYGSIEAAYVNARRQLSTSRLTSILLDAIRAHAPPQVGRRRIKLRYAHAGGTNPPVIVIHGNQTDSLPDHYRRYLANTFRDELSLRGTPLNLQFRTGENPYAGRKNPLTPRQRARRKRLLKHVRKRS